MRLPAQTAHWPSAVPLCHRSGVSNLHVLMDGIALGESPRWHENRLWFADWGALEIIAVSPDGNSEVTARVPSMPICFDWLPDKGMVIVSGRDGKLLRRDANGSLVTHADLAA